MSAKQADEKVLRIGIIQGGKIVEERLLRKHQKVTVGLSPRNSFVVPLGDLKSFLLFDLRGRKYELCFTSKMDGRVAVRGRVLGLDGLKAEGLAHRKGNEWRLSVGGDDRGKVTIDDVTVLFQFVVAPPLPARPKLPAVARGGWIKSVDWVYTSIVIGIGIVEASLIGYMKTLPPPEKKRPTLEDLDQRFARLLVPELVRKPEVEKPKPTEPDAEAAAKAAAEAKARADRAKAKARATAKAGKRRRAGSEAGAKGGEPNLAQVKEKVGKVGMLKILGQLGDAASGPGSPVADVFDEGNVDRDLDTSFKKAESLAIAQTHGRGRSPKGGGAEGVGTTETISDEKIGAVGRRRVRRVKVQRKAKRALPKPSLRTGSAEVEGGALDPDKISRVLKRRRGAVIWCYQNALKRDPELRGKVTVRFTIGPTGAVIAISIDSNTMRGSSVARCVVRRLRRFRFPRPQGGSVTVTYPFIFTATR